MRKEIKFKEEEEEEEDEDIDKNSTNSNPIIHPKHLKNEFSGRITKKKVLEHL